MDTATDFPPRPSPTLAQRTDHWGDWSAVSLYLDRCQVDTPRALTDVVRCVTSLRRLPADVPDLDPAAFDRYCRDQGATCWLIRTDQQPSAALRLYLDSVPESSYQTATCLSRSVWWQFDMPKVPDALFAQSFKATFPKCAKNTAQAHAVGGVCGIYNITDRQLNVVASGFRGLDLRDRVVAHSNGFRKIEIGQLSALLQQELQIGDA